MTKFEIRPYNWSKRRIPTDLPLIAEYRVHDFVPVPDTYCTVLIRYENSNEFRELTGRVCENSITKKLTINGINSSGDFIILDVMEFA